MSKASPIWVWTPPFSRRIAAAGVEPAPDIRIIRFDPADPGGMLFTFRQLREAEGDRPVIIFDVARFPDETDWAYAADVVNRSGTNPMRGLGAVMREPFVDVSRLYRVPAGKTGLVAISLGARYPGIDSKPSEISPGRPICSYLHDAAILAHAEGMAVTGVLVAEAHITRFDFQQVLIG